MTHLHAQKSVTVPRGGRPVSHFDRSPPSVFYKRALSGPSFWGGTGPYSRREPGRPAHNVPQINMPECQPCTSTQPTHGSKDKIIFRSRGGCTPTPYIRLAKPSLGNQTAHFPKESVRSSDKMSSTVISYAVQLLHVYGHRRRWGVVVLGGRAAGFIGNETSREREREQTGTAMKRKTNRISRALAQMRLIPPPPEIFNQSNATSEHHLLLPPDFLLC